MRARRITSLARSPWPSSPAIAWAWIASVLVLCATWYSHGFHSGVRGGLIVFVTWAIVRELAPGRAAAAAVAPFAAVAFAIPSQSDLLACVGVLMLARVAARTVGTPLTWLDLGVLGALSVALAQRPAGVPVAIVLCAVLASDGRWLPARVAGPVALVAVLVVGSLEGTLTARPRWHELGIPAQVLLAATALAAVWLLLAPLPRRIAVFADRGRSHLRGTHLRRARVAVVATVAAEVAWIGTDAPFQLAAACAALLACGALGATARAAEPAPVVR